MQEKILLKMDNPPQLEKLYRDNKPAFKTAFNKLYPELKDNPSARVWYERLNYARQDTFWGTSSERTFVVAIGLLAVLFAQLPKIFSLDKDFFYTRNAGFIALPLLMAYFGWKNKVSAKTLTLLSGVVVISIFFINYLPKSSTSDTLVLSSIHLPLLLWSLLGFVFGGGRFKKGLDWLGFLRYNGELLVMTALLLISCGLVSAMTINLFGMIGLQIERHYFEYVVISGLAALPIVSTFLTQVQPAIVNKVSPVIANLFSPVAFVMLVAYLAAIVFSGKDPYHDREFLLLFNGLLIGVMALIFFSVADSPSGEKKLFQKILLFPDLSPLVR
jgi:hypothetical protein